MKMWIDVVLHGLVVTGRSVSDFGPAVKIERDLLLECGLREHQQVSVQNLRSGASWECFVLAGGRQEFDVTGAPALLVDYGDRCVVSSYVLASEADRAGSHSPVIQLDADNLMATRWWLGQS